MNCQSIIRDITYKARQAAAELAIMPTKKKNKALLAMAKAIENSENAIQKANRIDLLNAEKNKRNKAFIDRLTLNEKRTKEMASIFGEVAKLSDPVGALLERQKRPNGLIIEKRAVPIGVIGIIYEARPNVTADCVALCFKSGNSVILRGGSDAINSNKAVYEALKRGACSEKIPEGAFILIEDTRRGLIDEMLKAQGRIDLIMPRGGEALIREVSQKSKIPVIKHYKGICHVYVDAEADLDMAQRICINAKTQRPGVCNAMETMLVHKAVAGRFLPKIASQLKARGVVIKGCPITRRILGGGIEKAIDKDFATEWLDLILNVRVVDSLGEAIEHIAKFGSDHSDSIVTESYKNAEEFTKRVDSAAVYVNASTRFTDGGQFGKGAEIGISTDKLHARGPMGLEELCSYKYVVYGKGQVRE